MPSLFADQFNYAGPYGLNGLPTSAPTVSLRLPDAATPKGADPQEKAREARQQGRPAQQRHQKRPWPLARTLPTPTGRQPRTLSPCPTRAR
jgi:hypothetical protein